MDLFVVNRHVENEEGQQQQTQQETSNFDRLLRKVEKRKKQRIDKKLKTQEIAKKIENTKLQRKLKRERKTLSTATENDTKGQDKKVENIPEEETLEKTQTSKKAESIEGFTVLGGEKFAKRKKVKRVLPQWLSQPSVISVNLQELHTKVSEMNFVDRRMRKKLKANGVDYLFPVQSVVIPWLLEENRKASSVFPRDVCVSAPTGSGKTLAFALPIIQLLGDRWGRRIRALIMLPTQDLAFQVFNTFRKYNRKTKVEVALIAGYNSFKQEQNQLIGLEEGFGYYSKVDILVCTAGRLVDHLKNTPGFDLTHLEFLVIDEADRVLDNIQNDWLFHLDKHLQKTGISACGNSLTVRSLCKRRPPQKLLFSATLSQDPEKLQKLSLFQPMLFTSLVENSAEGDDDLQQQQQQQQNKIEDSFAFVGKYTTPNELTEKYVLCNLETKPLLLFKLIEREKLKKTMVFTHSLESVHRLTVLLKTMLKGYKIEEISSNFQMQHRKNLIEKFANEQIDLLICTDAMARGIDLQDVHCVISYSAPKYLKTYIHRVGRTARAGKQGLAITLVQNTQLTKFTGMMQQANKDSLKEIKIEEEELEPYTEKYQQALEELQKSIALQEKKDLQKLKSDKRPRLKRKRGTSKSE